MKYLPTAALLLLLTAGAHAAPFPKGNAEAGKTLFAQNNCNRCHDGIMGGDGNAIFTRPNHKVKSAQQLVAQLRVCSGGAGITLTPQDEQDMGAYLSREYYHFK